MRHTAKGDPADGGTPVSVETAFRRVRLLVGALVLARLWGPGAVPRPAAVALAAGIWSVNLVGRAAERRGGRDRALLGVVQLLADTLGALALVWLQRAHTGGESADWAVLVLPAIEGAVRFGAAGAFGSWVVVAGGYAGGNLPSPASLPAATVAQRLTVVLLVALPVGYLAGQLVAEIDAHRDARDRAEHRSALLRAVALGGRRASRLDVDGILAVICTTAAGMGFGEPAVFALHGPHVDDPVLRARPVAGSGARIDLPPGDARILAAAAAHAAGAPVVRPGPDGSSILAVAIPTVDDERVALTARCPVPDPDLRLDEDDDGDAGMPEAVESLELFAAQAGASLHNARVHRGLEELKDRLDHQASHDALTDLANRRRFADELDRAAGRGRPGDLLGVLFLDLDGFKSVNDHYGHETGNELLVAVATRLRDCVRPGDLVARIGGDEFTIMLTRLESIDPASSIAERVCTLLTEPFMVGDREIQISTSVGVAVAPAESVDAADLLRRADAAMYRAKSLGKGRWSMDPGSGTKTLAIGAEIHASPQGTCNDAPRTPRGRMEEM